MKILNDNSVAYQCRYLSQCYFTTGTRLLTKRLAEGLIRFFPTLSGHRIRVDHGHDGKKAGKELCGTVEPNDFQMRLHIRASD